MIFSSRGYTHNHGFLAALPSSIQRIVIGQKRPMPLALPAQPRAMDRSDLPTNGYSSLTRHPECAAYRVTIEDLSSLTGILHDNKMRRA
jgi:hypothetical protein